MVLKSPVRMLQKREVCSLFGFGPATLWRKVVKENFPKPYKLNNKTVAWREDELAAYQNNLEQAEWSSKVE